jgi:glycosyltransferase involved in cell wall biosynthesis
VVGTRITGIPELIEDGETGLLVAPGSHDQLVESLERLLVDPELRRRLGENAREKVIGDFNAENSAAQLHALFADQLLPSASASLRPRVPEIANEGV